ncbi:Menin [Triplophysa tibetana]|uniref:Menin n=1 Tax=Triplophysa tibetana TaxID=1572043 RepID=A0A5A9PMF6_9TELE|nr:Menin [Triplophysa tibetana]
MTSFPPFLKRLHPLLKVEKRLRGQERTIPNRWLPYLPFMTQSVLLAYYGFMMGSANGRREVLHQCFM